ncbi:hypothetical protein BAY61_14025 [Prauserella marina]|uniref:Uncharacterized protein n=1 Tax=Prauserella marina TaxID=530584 RepID=A0A222VPV5_9PSEU|nr:hypothetical protein [Prauserella marina]ASR35937.1 hypothetical protein BAY61_14025 [Prauserella marina]PWV84133.1 hypothetical protein DES30_101150 [Prauserella marina]SDC29614.1 hypothetical protein SAMN05421630_1011187 [Prauserella marina]
MWQSATLLARLWRRIHPGRNPLVRLSDRVESAALVAAVVIPLLALPFVAAVGSDSYAREIAVAQQQQRTRHEVEAVLLTDAPATQRNTGTAGTGPTVSARAEWSLPDGSRRTGMVPARAAAPAGTTVEIWLDETGRPVPPPMSRGVIAWNAFAVSLTVWIGVVLLSGLLFVALRHALDRGRYHRWQSEWSAFDRERHES